MDLPCLKQALFEQRTPKNILLKNVLDACLGASYGGSWIPQLTALGDSSGKFAGGKVSFKH